ncbi:MAG: uroporphyrinogen-III synthase [Paracoccaceae bacterium]|nr:uroporphyrinogen-III synthase [Paracoccaceae bacterium]
MTLSFKKPIILTRVNADNKEFVQSFSELYPNIDVNQSFRFLSLFEIVLERKLQEKLDFDYLVCTSRYAIQAIPSSENVVSKYMLCVGKRTALAAMERGFNKVFYPKVGNASNLVKLISLKVEDKNSNLHYLRGKEVSYDLKLELEKFGYKVHETIVYRQKKLKLAEKIRNFLTNENVGGVIFFSANVAKSFCHYFKKFPEDFLFFCISDRVAQEVLKTQVQHDYKIRVASEPTTKEIMKLVYNEEVVRQH